MESSWWWLASWEGGGGSKKFLYWILLSNFSRKKDLPFHPATLPRNRTVPPPDRYVSCCGALTVSIGLKRWTFEVVRRIFLRRKSCVFWGKRRLSLFSPFLFFLVKIGMSELLSVVKTLNLKVGMCIDKWAMTTPWWLFRIYRGLYYPVVWGLQKTIRIPIKKQPVQWKK